MARKKRYPKEPFSLRGLYRLDSSKLSSPSKSVDSVNNIVKTFKDGTRDNAEFWIDMKALVQAPTA